MRILPGLLLLSALSGCHLSHLTTGQYDLLSRRQPITGVLADPRTGADLRRQLERVLEARAFAVRTLHLPDNDSYSDYADLERPYAVWNVFATPEFSMAGKTWCYPFSGCVAYRGYFDEARARDHAADLKADGWDVHVGGVPAYSTLGWFDDPVLNTMLYGDEDRLTETLFHELAHQQLYVEGDTAFNESFASFVGEEGLRQYRAARGEPPPDTKAASRERQFLELLLAARARLEAIYAQPLNHEAMRAAKQAEFSRLRTDYAALKKSWNGYAGYDGWFAGELNNAKLLPVGLYNQRVPEFAELFRAVGGDWRLFYEKAPTLAKE